MGRLLAVASALVSALGATPVRAAEPSWKLAYQHRGLSVYQDGTDSKPSYMIEGVIDANLFSVLAVLADVAHRSEWVRDLKESRIVEGDVEKAVVIYEHYHLPWPCHDRDAIAYSQIAEDDSQLSVTVTYHEVTRADIPPRPGIVRMPSTRGSMFFRYLDKGHCFARVLVRLDVGGRLPGFIVNWVARAVPAITVDSLLARVKATRGRYDGFVRAHAATARLHTKMPFDVDL
ncbi:MAG TPA: START domain-containing protein [Myxococcales bacterium]|nr:START domain-containing protein [Myxococcales bacterium]